MGVFNQIVCTAIGCYVSMSLGLTFAWPSCTFKIFASENTTLSRPMTEAEISLFGSLSSVGAMISVPLTGFGLDRIGRKYCALLAIMAHVITWTLIAVFSYVEVILIAIFISGLGGSAFLVIPVFVSEICQESIRGTMTSGSMIFYAIGMLIAYLIGGCLPPKIVVYICMTLAVVGIGLLSFVRETPTFLLMKGKEEEAAKSFAFYRNAKLNSKIVFQEMDKLRRAFNPELENENENTIPEAEKLKQQEQPTEKLSVWQFFKKSRATRRAIVVTLTLITASTFQGLVVLQVYAEPLFSEAVPNISSTLCSVLLALVTIVSGFTAAYLTDLAGRRPLIIYSSLAGSVCCLALGTQLHFHWAPDWVTALFIYLFTTAYTFGAGTVPFVLVAEVFSPEVKSFMSTFVTEWAWLCNFIILFIFNPLVSAMGLGPVFYLFAIVCFCTSLYTVKYLPETKGLPIDAIQAKFAK